MSKVKEYQICLNRGHQKSGRTVFAEGETWDICRHCDCGFRHVTILKELNVPKHD